MIPDDFSFAAEKLAQARRPLMAPHRHSEDARYVNAFHECSLGLRRIPRDDLDENARGWVAIIEEASDTTGISDPREAVPGSSRPNS